MNSNDFEKRATALLSEARMYICRHFDIFMDAIYNWEAKADPTLSSPMTTDGIYFYYHPQLLCMVHENYDLKSIVYGMMHLCAHCILGHLQSRERVKNKELFDVLADYKVHKMLSVLIKDKEYGDSVKKMSKDVHLKYNNLPLHQAYQRLMKDKKNAEKYLLCAEAMEVDNHELWHRPKENQGEEGQTASGMDEDEDGDDSKENNGNEENQGNQKKNSKNNAKTGGDSAKEMPTENWQNIKEKMEQNNILLFIECNENFGTESGSNYYDYNFDWDSEMNYKDILEEFLRKSTVEVENPQSIDPVWYYFGLDHLDEVPLIEALEEDERPSEGTLIIAMDTSGSCEGEICQQFLGELDSLMTHLELMGSLNRVVLLQCDSRIQETLEMSSPEEWSHMMAHFQVKGGGGTNFCPVFEEAEAYKDMVGLIYLSDGFGNFPNNPPTYPTLFLLTEDEDGDCGAVPSWVERAYL